MCYFNELFEFKNKRFISAVLIIKSKRKTRLTLNYFILDIIASLKIIKCTHND